MFQFFFEYGLYFLPFPLISLLIQNIKHKEDFTKEKARKMAFWNAVFATFFICMYSFIDIIINELVTDILYIAESMLLPTLHTIPFYWISLIILSKGKILKEEIKEEEK